MRVPAGAAPPSPFRPEPTSDDSTPANDEYERLLDDRTLRLIGLGFSWEQAEALAHLNDVAHIAEALLKRGCPHAFVVDELT